MNSELDAKCQQIRLNRKERPLRLFCVAAFLALAFGFGTGQAYVPAAIVMFASIMAAEPFDRMYLARPTRLRYAMCLAWCWVDGIIPAIIYVMILERGDGLSLFMALTMVWIMTSQSIVVRTHDLNVYVATVAPGFIGFGYGAMQLGPPVFPDGFQGVVLICVGLQLAFALQTGWVSRRIRSNLIDALDRVEQSRRSKDRFFAMVSHEIRTPLNGIMGIGQMMTNSSSSAEETERAQTILASGKAMSTLLDDLLNHAKLEAGQFVANSDPMRIDRILRNVVGLFSDMASSKGLPLKLETSDALPDWITGDAIRVQQILSNLVSNAIKHTDAGQVRIVAAPADRDGRPWVDLSVHDTGTGIPPDRIEQIFLPYEQLADTASKAGIGTGLGLAIARALAELMGGTVTVASEPGRGSTFTLSLPIVPAEAPAEADPDASREKGGSLAGLRILVVDDTTLNRRIARSFLELAGAEVEDAAHGEAALGILSQAPIDLILTDLHMPGMDGTALLSAIRAQPDLRTIPVICLTADHQNDMSEFDGQIAKPLDRAELCQTVLKTVRRRPAAAA